MKLNQAIDGFLLFKSGEGLSPRTLDNYDHYLRLFAAHAHDAELHRLAAADVAGFLDWLRTGYRPTRLTGDDAPLSSQSIRNAWTALKSFTTWAARTLDAPDVMTGRVLRPKAHNIERIPLTADEVRRLPAQLQPRRAKRPKSGAYYVEALRDRATVLTLLDTGIRASEFCDLRIADWQPRTGRLSVVGKGAKHRYVWTGAVTRPALWQYLQERSDADDPARPLFTGREGRPLSISRLRKRLVALGQSADVSNCHPHRFRYTFAIEYLRNGGDVFTLQALLGHSSLKMVSHYLRLSQMDAENVHHRASPVDKWLKDR